VAPLRRGLELAELVQDEGNQLYSIAREFVAATESEWTRRPGRQKLRRLRTLLEELNQAL